jgi:hypothetical protein
MNNISEKITKYVHVNPQLFSFTMLGLSTMMLVYFIANNDEDNEQPENVTKEAEAESESESKEEPNEEDIPPQQGGSRCRKNKSKKTKRRQR